MHQPMADDARRGGRRDPPRSRRRPGAGARDAAALADDRAAHAEGLDRPEGGRRPAGGGHLPLPPGAAAGRARPTPSTWRSSRSGCAATGPRSCSTRAAPSCPSWRALAPAGERRMGANPHANGGLLLRDLELPDFRDYAVTVEAPGSDVERGHPRARRLPARRDAPQRDQRNFRVFGPDETASNRLGAVFEATDRAWVGRDRARATTTSSPDGRVMEVLSEHLCQGWLEGYLLTGRHGLFNCYEAFIHIVDSMFNQHAKWLKVTRDDPVAAADRVAQLPALLARLAPGPQRLLAPGPGLHRPRGEQEGRDHPRLPAARRQLPAVGGRPLPASRDYVNVIVAGKQPALDYLTMDEAAAHCARGIGIWDWASNDDGDGARRGAGLRRRHPHPGDRSPPRACCAEHLPDLRVRVVNVVDLMRLQPDSEHPHGMPDAEFDALFTTRPAGDLRLPRLPLADPPPHLPAHQPPRPARARLQGGGHHHHALRHGDAQRHGPLPPRHGRDRPRARAWARGPPTLRQAMVDERLRHRAYTREIGDDPPDVRDWTWPG